MANTKDVWSDFTPYYLELRGTQNVPDRYLRSAVWVQAEGRRSEGGYYARSTSPGTQGGEQLYPVEFNFDHLCWVEVRWHIGENSWHAFRKAEDDLDLNIPIPDTPAGEYWEHDTDDGTPSNAQNLTESESEDESSEPEEIEIHPNEEVEQLTQLAESQLVIASMATVTIPSITDSENAQVRRGGVRDFLAGGPSGSGPPRDPFNGRPPPEELMGGGRSGGPPGGSGGGPPGGSGGGPPGGSGGGPPGGAGGGPPGGGPPSGAGIQQGQAPRPSDKFIGREPQIFEGDRSKAEEFITQWNLFVGVNYPNPAIQNPYQRSMMFLTYIQGAHVSEWVASQHRWLQEQVTTNGVLTTSNWLWNTLERAFRRTFADTMSQERAQAELKRGVKMEKQNLDEYVAKFERLVRHAGYDLDNLQTIDLFTAGLPNQLYQKIYDLDDPQTYNQWKTCALERQRKWIHAQARGLSNLSQRTPTIRPQPHWGPRANTPQYNRRDPNAMDTSPGRIRARVAGSEQANPNNAEEWNKFIGGQRSTPAPRGGGRGNGFNIREVTCYNCRQTGHFSRDCPQQYWNRGGNQTRETNPFRSGWRGHGRGMGHNPRNNPGGRSNARIGEVEPEESNADTSQVAWAITNNSTSQQRADYWLDGVAQENDEVKDMVLHGIWKRENVEMDFPNA